MKTFAPLCVVLVLSLMTGALALTDEVEQNSVAYSAELQNVLAGLPSEDYSGPAIEDLRFSSGGCVAIAYCGDTKSVADMVMAKLESTAAWKNKKLAIRPPDDYANVLERGAYDNLIFAFNDGTEIQASNCGGTTRSAIYLWDTSCQAARPGCMQDKLNVFKSGSQYLFTPVPISGPMDLNSLEFCSSFYDLKCGYMGSEIVEKNIFLAGVDKDSLEAVANLVFGNVDGTLAAADANGWTIQGQDTEGWASRSLGLPDGQDYEFRFKLDTSSGSPVGHSSDTGYVISLLGDGKFVGTHAGVPETVWTGLSCDSRQTNRLLLTYNWNIETISAICTKGTSGLQFKVSVDSIDEAKKIIYIKVEEAKANDIIRSDVGNGIKAVGFKVNFPVTEGVFKGMSSSQHLGLVKFDENADIGPWEMGDSKRLSDNELVVATVELITDADSLMVLVSTGESAQSVAVLVDDTTLTPWVTSQLRWQDQDSGKDVFAELITIPLTQLRGGVHTVQVKSAQAGASETAEGVAVFTLRVQLQLTTKKFLYEGSRGIPLEGFSTYMTREVPGNIKSGIAYRFLPEGLNFTGDVTLNIKHDGQDFTNGSGIGVYRYEDAEIDRDCQVQILDQSTQSVVMGGLFELGDVQLIFASDALPSSTDITIQKLQLTCNDAVLVAADQTGDGTEAPVASPKKGADNTWIIVALIVVVLLMGVYWFRKSKSK